MTYVLFVLGFFVLVKGADFLIDGSSAIARRFGVSRLIIGLTIVAFGTSMPELVINVMAALSGNTDIAFGNVVGSNLANILLILGAMAIIAPPRMDRINVWRDLPFSFLVTGALIVLANDMVIDASELSLLTRSDGIILLGFFAVFLYTMLLVFLRRRKDKPSLESPEAQLGWGRMFGMIVLGVVGLYVGGVWIVDGAVAIARAFGLTEFVIAASIIAVGTSVPELATSLRAALRKDTELAVGNIIGSNIFNILTVLAIAAVISPVTVPAGINTDLFILLSATGLLFLFNFTGRRYVFKRMQGVVFVVLYILYLGFLFIRG